MKTDRLMFKPPRVLEGVQVIKWSYRVSWVTLTMSKYYFLCWILIGLPSLPILFYTPIPLCPEGTWWEDRVLHKWSTFREAQSTRFPKYIQGNTSILTNLVTSVLTWGTDQRKGKGVQSPTSIFKIGRLVYRPKRPLVGGRPSIPGTVLSGEIVFESMSVFPEQYLLVYRRIVL